MRDTLALSTKILNWYDRHARSLPWRIPSDQSKQGVLPNPYHVWLSEIMLQQTQVATVIPYFNSFIKEWPSIQQLAKATEAQILAKWAGLGYYSRARNLHKCAKLICKNYNASFPQDLKSLQALPGIGPYTSASISSIAFGQQETVIDGNIERVISRLYAIETPLPTSKKSIQKIAKPLTPKNRSGDYAQAMMDLGATICTPKSPSCETCPLQSDCKGYALGVHKSLPRKIPKKPKPTRHATAFVVWNNKGEILMERRPDKGLLAGTIGIPLSDWDEPNPTPPIHTNWITHNQIVKHTFTHFHLEIDLLYCHYTKKTRVHPRFWMMPAQANKDSPTLMKKIISSFDIHFTNKTPR